MQLGELGGQGHVAECTPVEPNVETLERSGVGPPGAFADGDLDPRRAVRVGRPISASLGVDPRSGGAVEMTKPTAASAAFRKRYRCSNSPSARTRSS